MDISDSDSQEVTSVIHTAMEKSTQKRAHSISLVMTYLGLLNIFIFYNYYIHFF